MFCRDNEGMKKRGIDIENADSGRKCDPVKTKPESEDQVLKTRQQMAERLQLSVRTIDYWTDDGTLPVYRKGRVVRYHPDECDRALQAFRTRSRFEAAGNDHN